MLFNSYTFIFIFLPVVLLGFFYFGKQKHSLAMLWLAATSLFFLRMVGCALCWLTVRFCRIQLPVSPFYSL
jgi:hypothetical protein